jgi:hypothetical protein
MEEIEGKWWTRTGICRKGRQNFLEVHKEEQFVRK